jgi:CRP-like cAMP-binding protein
MHDVPQPSVRNYLLRALEPEAFDALRGHLEPMQVEHRFSLIRSMAEIEYVYFPESGLASVTTDGARYVVEVAMVGREGFVGVPVVLGPRSCSLDAIVQTPGTFLRIGTEALLAAMHRAPAIRELLLLYVQAYFVQTSYTAMTNARYCVEDRLARWILMCHDRSDSDELPVTHDYLAMMLGVRRPGVTVATHLLEGARMIRARRGRITVLDRAKLEGRVKESYGAPEAEYKRLLPLARPARITNGSTFAPAGFPQILLAALQDKAPIPGQA